MARQNNGELKPQVPENGSRNNIYNLGCIIAGLPLAGGFAKALINLPSSFEPGVGYTGQTEAGLSILAGAGLSGLLCLAGMLIERVRSKL
jgi:hypothetical protein